MSTRGTPVEAKAWRTKDLSRPVMGLFFRAAVSKIGRINSEMKNFLETRILVEGKYEDSP
jgi:hypothetical protein